ncbi:acyl carrier protein [Candidatus Accumulibacter aalborgensis]|uniref:acyl carrier protein n=1 Tax=Candidatus Accumulibacter aalborgensis TaxID=1860102 RepID=UPI001645A556|nr:acyl carrier protein [Candidatus Accumulibacter aalborgensis]
MSIERIRSVFSQALGLPEEFVNDQLLYSSVKAWDSVAHMALVAALEDEFGIMLDTEDVIDMSSFVIAVEIMRKHGVDT